MTNSQPLPLSSYRGSPSQRTYKGWAQLKGLMAAELLAVAAQTSWMVVIVSPWSQGACRTGLFSKGPFGSSVFLSEQRRSRHFHLVQRRKSYRRKNLLIRWWHASCIYSWRNCPMRVKTLQPRYSWITESVSPSFLHYIRSFGATTWKQLMAMLSDQYSLNIHLE